MNKAELQEVVNRLEALEALAKLFNNLWFDQIKKNIHDEKVQAYLLVFEDAFPHMNHVIEFVRRSAGVLSESSTADQWDKLHGEFESLRGLLQGTANALSATEPASMLPQEQEALESVGQSDLDTLFDDSTPSEKGDIDALFEVGSESTETVQDIDGLFNDEAAEDDEEFELEDEEEEIAESIGAEMIDESEDLDEDDALEAAEALEPAEVDEADVSASEAAGIEEEEIEEEVEIDADDAGAGDGDSDDELGELMQDVDDDDMADEDVNLGDLLEEETPESDDSSSDEEEDVELDGLFEEEEEEEADADGAGISEDEMSALLDEEDSGGEDGDGEDVAAEEKDDTGDADSDDDENSISQDEIDALFG